MSVISSYMSCENLLSGEALWEGGISMLTAGAGGVGLVGLMTVLTGGRTTGGGGLGGGTFSFSSSVSDVSTVCVAVTGGVICTGLVRYSTCAPVNNREQ